MIRKITRCRISGSPNLVPVLSLGTQKLTGVFPRTRDAALTEGPLELVWCPDSGLLQLRHSYEPDEMYGANYGYRSGLNQSMVRHLTDKVRQLAAAASPRRRRPGAGHRQQRRHAAEGLRSPGICAGWASTRRASSSRASTATASTSFPTSSRPMRSARASETPEPGSSRRSRCSTTWRPRWSSSARWRRSWPTTASGTSSRATCRRCCA